MDNTQHRTVKTALKIVGGILLVLGVILAAVGLIDFFASVGTMEMPTRFWCCFIGLPISFSGLVCLLWGFRREIAQYAKNEVTPVAGEAIVDLTPAAADLARAVHTADTACLRCGTRNAAGAKFCNGCGAPLVRRCTACETENEAGAKFCGNCGKPL